AQVQLWRDWRQTGPAHVQNGSATASHLERLLNAPQPAGNAIPLISNLRAPHLSSSPSLTLYPSAAGPVSERVALILPTSLCAGQIARMTAHRLNQLGLGREREISRFVA